MPGIQSLRWHGNRETKTLSQEQEQAYKKERKRTTCKLYLKENNMVVQVVSGKERKNERLKSESIYNPKLGI